MRLVSSGACSAHYRTGLNRGENRGKLHAAKPAATRLHPSVYAGSRGYPVGWAQQVQAPLLTPMITRDVDSV